MFKLKKRVNQRSNRAITWQWLYYTLKLSQASFIHGWQFLNQLKSRNNFEK